MGVRSHNFECVACHDEVTREASRCPKFCVDCFEFRSAWLTKVLNKRWSPYKVCKGCHVRMSNLDHPGQKHRCDECLSWSAHRRPHGKLIIAANDNEPLHKGCRTCKKVLSIASFHKKQGGVLGTVAHCIECERVRFSCRDRSAETAAKKLRREVDPNVVRRITKSRKIKIIERLRKSTVAKKSAERRAAERQTKPWLVEGLSSAESRRVRRLHDPDFMLYDRTRSRIKRKGLKGNALKDMRQALKSIKGNCKRAGLEDRLGYTIKSLREHLERQFTEGMSWDAFTEGRIHIDHVRPLNTFDLTLECQASAAWALRNLRPLWAQDNMRRPKDGSDVDWQSWWDDSPMMVAA